MTELWIDKQKGNPNTIKGIKLFLPTPKWQHSKECMYCHLQNQENVNTVQTDTWTENIRQTK